MASKVNVREIINKHISTLQSSNGKLNRKDKKIFIYFPLLLGFFLSLTVGVPNEVLLNIFAVCLSIFIGLFLNLLVLIISFAENKLNVKDKRNRAILLEQTFYNITYTIIASLIGLGLLFISNVDFFPENWTADFNPLLSKLSINIKLISINSIFKFIFYFFFYSVFCHIIITLLMIIKRIFKLFKVEIEHINNKINTTIY